MRMKVLLVAFIALAAILPSGRASADEEDRRCDLTRDPQGCAFEVAPVCEPENCLRQVACATSAHADPVPVGAGAEGKGTGIVSCTATVESLSIIMTSAMSTGTAGQDIRTANGTNQVVGEVWVISLVRPTCQQTTAGSSSKPFLYQYIVHTPAAQAEVCIS